MRVIIDATGRVLAAGGDSLVVPAGGRSVEVEAGEATAFEGAFAALGADEELAHDGAAFVVRARVLSAAEQQFRADVQAVKTFMAAANGSATDAQRDAVFKATIRILRRVIAELRDEGGG